MSDNQVAHREPYKPSLWRREKLYLLSWEDLGKGLQKIRDQILSDGFRPVTVIGISRGGLVPATYFSHALHVDDFEVLGIARNASDDIFCLKREPELLWTSANRDYTGSSVLLVDDVAGEGKTLDFAVKFLKGKGATKVLTAVIARIQKCEFMPDYCAVEVDDWIVFPWENTALDGSKQTQPIYL
ncbi:MAG TPA: phosphoribosyltransferase family protein [Pyrinomonadaceae bacterium]|nr:phosphoribosyltransferase family protein [Pyrinomonadaceae bacterium]